MLAMARANTRDDAPGLTYTAVEEYFDKERYDREVALLFRRHPVVVGFSAQLRKPGDFVTNNDTGQPILVTRGTTEGCAPSSTSAAIARDGRAEALRRTSGLRLPLSRLELRPHRPRWSASPTPPVRRDRSQHARLAPLAVAERCGMVWVVPTALEAGEHADLDIDSYLGPMKPDLGPGHESWEVHSSVPIRPRMNWKLVIDTFLELYHFRYLHRASVAPLFLDNITTYERRDRHSRFAAAKPT